MKKYSLLNDLINWFKRNVNDIYAQKSDIVQKERMSEWRKQAINIQRALDIEHAKGQGVMVVDGMIRNYIPFTGDSCDPNRRYPAGRNNCCIDLILKTEII